VVAVIDTGVDLGHPYLRDHRWVNAGEVAGNGIDDDGDGIVDDVNGGNFIDHTGNPRDDEGHGTHVAGIAATSPSAATRTGVDPAVEIMALKVNKGLWMDLGAAAEAVYYAADRGAQIINLSWGSRSSNRSLEQAISYATARGVLVVAAAGNLRSNNDVLPDYPSSYPDPGIISVAASCDGQTIAPFSNVGKLSIDIAAPGCNVVSAVPGGYKSLSGTSMAASAVSGAAALLAASRPSAGGRELKRALLAGARPAAGLDAAVASGGALDVAGALAALSRRDVTRPAPFAQIAPAKAFAVERSPTTFYQEVTFAWRPSSDSALAGYEVLLDGVPIAGIGAGQTSLITRVAPGEHVWSVVAYDRSGNTTTAST
jgi:subtilisin family serine protease